jgi:hypothetical protein
MKTGTAAPPKKAVVAGGERVAHAYFLESHSGEVIACNGGCERQCYVRPKMVARNHGNVEYPRAQQA